MNREALVDACVRASIADHDLARDLGRVEDRIPTVVGRGEAEPDGCSICARQARTGRVDDRPRRQCRRQAGAVIGHAIAESRRAFAVAVMRACRNRGDPRARVSDGGRGWTGVAGRCRDEHAGVSCEQERHLDGIQEVRRSAADREVDHVHAVRYGLIDGRDAVRAEATAVGRLGCPADLVHGDTCSGSDAAD